MDLLPIVLAIGATALILVPIVIITVGALITAYFDHKTKMALAVVEKVVVTFASAMMTYGDVLKKAAVTKEESKK